MAKRIFDIAVSLTGLVVVSPLLLLIAALIKADSKGPLFYRGQRVGRFGRPFRILKFRTMVVNAEQIGGSSTSDSDPRITRVGAVLRKCKFDELPQLFDVLTGKMSFVGPRPEVQQYVDMYTEEEQEILDIRPGITDWASIWNSDEGAILAGCEDPDKGYEGLIRPTKLRLQLFYRHRHSLLIDLKIIFYTAFKLLRKDFLPRGIQHLVDQDDADSLDRQQDFDSVTELPGHEGTPEQMSMMYTRYHLAAQLSKGKDLLELGCGPGVGLGYLSKSARRVVGGDFDPKLVEIANQHYQGRVEICRLDAQQLPYEDESFDVILLLEAIYYLPKPEEFVAEARRVLRQDGIILVCSANRERPDFNASPFTHKYFSAAELHELLAATGFEVETFGGYPVANRSLKGQILGVIRDMAVKLHLVPKTMKWKILLKRLLYGKLDPIPAELKVDDAQCQELIPIDSAQKVSEYKVIYAVGRRAA
jgi:lipopolysaccharide/colanic/teichoic acid biosynthesis glycosyltransferase/2-polyprenyl-3-methyl-5-hydroxy-6-metoxy-1,4-benzoquinol methylase